MSQKGSIRFYILARELGLESKDLLDLCKLHGIDVKNQLSSLTDEQREQVVQLTSKGPAGATAPPPAPVSLPQGLSQIRNLPPSRHPVGRGGPTPKAPPTNTATPLEPSQSRPNQRPVYDPDDNEGIEHLLDVGEQANLPKLAVLTDLAVIDPESAIFRIRKWCEVVCKTITGDTANDSLDTMIKKIEKQGLLTRRAVKYLDHIRDIGNSAVHPSDDPFDSEFTLKEVDRKAEDFAYVLEEAIRRGLFPVKP